MKVKVVQVRPLDEVASASGFERTAQGFYVVGDNSPWLFSFTKDMVYRNRIRITDHEEDIISKSEKNDLEAMSAVIRDGKEFLLLLSSGSKKPHRFTAILIDPVSGTIAAKYSLDHFYELVMSEARLDEEDLNIEAATELNGVFYLFNRGKNKLISMSTKSLFDLLEKKEPTIKMKAITVDLPEIDGIRAGFSGATSDTVNDRILFTASVENTTDWVQDGAVLGSFIGVIYPEQIRHHYQPVIAQIPNTGGSAVKVESIALIEDPKDERSLKCMLVTDNDEATSQFIEIEVELD